MRDGASPGDPEAPERARAVFLDRDGTIIRDVGYLDEVDRIEFIHGAVEGLRALRSGGYHLVVVSNQSGVARGYFTLERMHEIADALAVRLEREGVALSGQYYCPHYAGGSVEEFSSDCDCRKPGTGLVVRAAGELALDLAGSWMVGDKESDIAAGARTGMRSVLVLTGEGESTLARSEALGAAPGAVARDLLHASRIILGEEEPVQVGRHETTPPDDHPAESQFIEPSASEESR